MKKYLSWFSFFAFAILFSACAYAADAVPVDFGTALANLISAYKTHAGVAVIIVAVIELLKSDLVGGLLLKINQKWIPVIMLFLSGVGGAAQAVVAGKSWLQGILDGFITSGIAMSLYTTIKSISAPKS